MNTEEGIEKHGFWLKFRRREKFVCDRLRPGEICYPHRRVPILLRGVVAALCASVVTAPPILNRIALEPAEGYEAISNVVFNTGVVFILAWAASVLITTYMEEENILKYMLMSMGLPSLVLSASLLGQLPALD